MINMHSYECQAFLIDYGEVGDVKPRFCGFNRVGLKKVEKKDSLKMKKAFAKLYKMIW
jgi:hypothetical protein